MKDYFVYMSAPGVGSAWGCHAVSAGYSHVLPGSVYPAHQHPLDHHFTWSRGRILQSYTILFITGGTGVFESGVPSVRHRIEAGMVLLVFPGVWHRYAPDPETGWTENWVECSGPAFDLAQKAGRIRPDQPVLKLGPAPELVLAFDHCHHVAQHYGPGHQGVLATQGLHILAVIDHLVHAAGRVVNRMQDIVMRAQSMITSRCHEPLRMEALARELNVGYTQFRTAFRTHIGQTPKQYHQQVRLEQARKLLANTDKSIKEISELLGFESPFHFSKQFKLHMGPAPKQWRERQRRPGPGS